MSTKNCQEEYFRSVGGDDYFKRNSGHESPLDGHPSITLIQERFLHTLSHKGRAAVLGGAGGREAAALAKTLAGWELTNVDISQKAIDFGAAAYPNIRHRCMSITSTTPTLTETIGPQDLILVTGVLLWVDRYLLAQAIANIDLSLRDGGLLVIWDFMPPTNRRNPIRHSPNYFTFKQDYSKPFLSLGTYTMLGMESIILADPPDLDESERRAVTFALKKDLHGLYPVGYSG